MSSLALIISFIILMRHWLHVHGQTYSEINATEIFLIDEEILDKLREDTVTKLEHDESGQCIFVKSEEGLYSYSSPGGYKEVCGLYIIADPSEIVVFEFDEFDISCRNDGLASMIDGWELNGQFFPTTKDHAMPREERFMEYCGEKKPDKEIRMSQNVGLIEFRIPIQNEGFRVNVTFHKNPEPCNAILQNPQGVYTIRNHGKRLNCSVSIMFPESFQVISSDVGVKLKEKVLNENETSPLLGLTRECREGASDYVEIIGGDGLDTAIMRVAEAFCGIDNKPGKLKVDIACGNTAVRMVSSGNYENSVTIAFDLMTDKYKGSSLVCPGFLDSL